MNHYCDVHVLSDPELSESVLMSALFAKIHSALVELKPANIGISFPNFSFEKKWLGNLLRVHGGADELHLMAPFLRVLRDHVQIKAVVPVPEQTRFCVVRRVQIDSSSARLQRRFMRRHNVHIDELKNFTCDRDKRLNLPFVTIKSRSTGQMFHLFIEQKPVDRECCGNFNRYGLAQGGAVTVPLF